MQGIEKDIVAGVVFPVSVLERKARLAAMHPRAAAMGSGCPVPRCPVILHYGAKDERIPLAEADA